MRWVSYASTDGTERAGVLHENTIHAVAGRKTLLDLLTDGTMQDAGREALASPDEVVPLAQAQLLAPVPRPPSIRDFMAFETHVVTSMKSLGQTVDPLWYKQPAFYFTNPAAVIGPHDPVPIAPGSRMWDYELEMTATVNSRQYSEGTWADQFWSFAELLAYASRGTELRPGDVIGSGTVGTGCILELSGTHGSDAYPWLQPGDQVKLEVQSLGAITSTVMASPKVRPLRQKG